MYFVLLQFLPEFYRFYNAIASLYRSLHSIMTIGLCKGREREGNITRMISYCIF